MPNDKVTFSLRIPQSLIERLKKSAKESKRSANREAERIIEEYLDKLEGKHGDQNL